MSTHKTRLTRRRVLGASAAGLAATGAAVVAGPGLLSSASAATFGNTDDGANYVVDTGASLVFKVSKSTGDLNSLVYKGKEYEKFGGKHSHVETGLGASTVTIWSGMNVVSGSSGSGYPSPGTAFDRIDLLA